MNFFRSSLDQAFLAEDLDSRIHHLLQILLSKKSQWPDKEKPDAQERAANFLREISEYDPTSSKNYMMYIAREVAAGRIKFPEDGPHLKHALELFMVASKKREWKGQKDVMQYGNWRELQKQTNDWEDQVSAGTVPESETAYMKKAKAGAEKILEMDIESQAGLLGFAVVQCKTPASVTAYGRGTKGEGSTSTSRGWCTTASLYVLIPKADLEHKIAELTRQDSNREAEVNPWHGMDSAALMKVIAALNGGDLNKQMLRVPNPYYVRAIETAASYLREGPILIIYKNGRPYMQLTGNGSQIKNANDDELRTASPVLAMVLEAIIKSGKAPAAEKALSDHIKRRKERDAKRTPTQPPQPNTPPPVA